jgi:hypothetical protein
LFILTLTRESGTPPIVGRRRAVRVANVNDHDHSEFDTNKKTDPGKFSGFEVLVLRHVRDVLIPEFAPADFGAEK